MGSRGYYAQGMINVPTDCTLELYHLEIIHEPALESFVTERD